MRVVDYKTGRAPAVARELAEAKAMFQMKFYAVALLRSRGVLAARLRLLYLADGQVLDYTPDLDELLRFEKTLMAMWHAIRTAGVTGDFRPNPSRMCDWCAHHAALPDLRWHAAAVSGLADRRRPRGARGVIDLSLPQAAGRRRVSAVRVHAGTASNWNAEIQHGSPPLALMTKVIEELAAAVGAARRRACCSTSSAPFPSRR